MVCKGRVRALSGRLRGLPRTAAVEKTRVTFSRLQFPRSVAQETHKKYSSASGASIATSETKFFLRCTFRKHSGEGRKNYIENTRRTRRFDAGSDWASISARQWTARVRLEIVRGYLADCRFSKFGLTDFSITDAQKFATSGKKRSFRDAHF